MIRKIFTIFTLTAFFLTSFARPVFAEVITTEQAVNYNDHKEIVRNFLVRSDVQSQLISYGVDPDEAIVRIDSLSDAEIESLYSSINSMPAGGGDLSTVIGAILLVFFALLLTDILGLTKVYPFTRSIR